MLLIELSVCSKKERAALTVSPRCRRCGAVTTCVSDDVVSDDKTSSPWHKCELEEHGIGNAKAAASTY